MGKGYKRKNVYFTFVTESELVSYRIDLCSEKGEKRKSVYLTFVTRAEGPKRQNRGKREQEEKRYRIGRGCKWLGRIPMGASLSH